MEHFKHFKPVSERVGVNAGVLFCTLVYFNKKEQVPILGKQYIHVTLDELAKESTLSLDKINSAMKKLERNGFVEIVKRGIPCKNFYFINLEYGK